MAEGYGAPSATTADPALYAKLAFAVSYRDELLGHQGNEASPNS